MGAVRGPALEAFESNGWISHISLGSACSVPAGAGLGSKGCCYDEAVVLMTYWGIGGCSPGLVLYRGLG